MKSERESERNKGFLTKRDRLYLLGYADVEPESDKERDKRRRIRERVTDAILDYSYLIENSKGQDTNGLDAKDRERIFAPAADIRERFEQGLVDAIAFIYLGTFVSGGGVLDFQRLIERGVRRGERLLLGNEAVTVSVNCDVQRDAVHEMDWDDMENRIREEQWDELTEEELRLFLQYYAKSGEFDLERPGEYINDKLEDFEQWAREGKENRSEAARESQQTKHDYREDERSNSE